jgi:hypothetical protein
VGPILPAVTSCHSSLIVRTYLSALMPDLDTEIAKIIPTDVQVCDGWFFTCYRRCLPAPTR